MFHFFQSYMGLEVLCFGIKGALEKVEINANPLHSTPSMACFCGLDTRLIVSYPLS